MSDNRRVYRTIRKAIQQLYPKSPKGNLARHLNTMAALVCGIVQGKSCQLPNIAKKFAGYGQAREPDQALQSLDQERAS